MITGSDIQDSIKPDLVVRINTRSLINDSVFRNIERHLDSVVEPVAPKKRTAPATVSETGVPEALPDTTAVCSRNIVADITFSDSSGYAAFISPGFRNQLPWYVAEKLERENRKETFVIRDLKEGKVLTDSLFSHDWIIIVIFFTALVAGFIRNTSRSLLPGLSSFFLFRGIGDPSSRDTSILFRWHTLLLYFVSLLTIALFIHFASEYYGLTPGMPPFLYLALLFFSLIALVTVRYFIITLISFISEQREIFNEYLVTIYQSYNYLALILFFIIVMLTYSALKASGALLAAGFISFAILYVIRTTRLFFIFIKRSVSTFYLILYLCALEILPVLVFWKYLTSLA